MPDTPPSAVLAELTAAVNDARDVLGAPPPSIHYCGEQAGEGRFEASFWMPSTKPPRPTPSSSPGRISAWRCGIACDAVA